MIETAGSKLNAKRADWEPGRETQDYASRAVRELEKIEAWLLEIRPLVQEVGESHKSGQKTRRRAAQNRIWQSFRENIWQHKTFAGLAEFQGNEEARAEQKNLLNAWEEAFRENAGSGQAKELSLQNLGQSLYQDLEQYWLAEDLPQDLYQFPFRISIWMERISKAKNALTATLRKNSL